MPLPLETERLIIRPFTLEDAGAFHFILGDPEVMKDIPSGTSASVDETRERLRKIIKGYETWGFCLWALVNRRTGEMVGNCGLIPVEGKGPEVEVSYDIARKHWGKGYATEAARACLRYGLEELGLEEIIAMTFPHHRASQRVMEKAGMVYRENKRFYGQEMVVYSLGKDRAGKV